MINRSQYENAAQLYLRQNPKSFERYYSPSLLKTLVDAMLSSLPTTVAAGIAFNRLVANGQLVRTDGKSEADDRLEAVTAARANLDQVVAEVDAAPLSAAELAYFGSLSQRELSQLYFGEDGTAINEFAIRYRRAAREHMFRIPERIRSAEASTAEGDLSLSAREYHALPAAELKRRLRDPQFAAVVSKLIQRGEI
jgi:hypothetical protein